MFERIKEVFTKEYWNLKNITSSPRRKFLVKQVRIISLAIKGFNEDRVQVRASALTYYTLLSIVPIAAMAFGIAKGFGIDDKLQDYINKAFSSQKEVADYVLTFSEKYLVNISGGVIAGIGIVMLLWTVMRLLGNIELSFNDIWQIKKSRVMSRKMSDYISLVVVAPVLIVASSSVTVVIGDHVGSRFEYLGPLLGLITTFLPLILVWLVFTLLYIIMPNTKVHISSAIMGGIIGGAMFQLFQWVYVTFQKQLFNYGEVYGSFAALPLFLIWLQLSWLIVLFGAEIAFANQNVGHYESESESINISHHLKRLVSLIIVRLIAQNFRQGIEPVTAEEIANKLNIAVRLVRDILYELLEVGIVSETVTKNVKENAYQPAVDINKLNIAYVMERLDKNGKDTIAIEDEKEFKAITILVESFQEDMIKSKNNKLLVDL
ncbi:MAG: YihY family inner membrane protein [Bacteroidales bacterium]|nr:YihY family inner membrane protein [Bacteroidales bacterium]MBN2821007.1 YihY family inner membrane protein [Bacteroidales bacterium]